MKSFRWSLLGIILALGAFILAWLIPQNIILGVIAAGTIIAVSQALARDNWQIGSIILLAGGIVTAAVLMPTVDFYASVVVAATLVGTVGAAIRDGVRSAIAVAFAGGIVALAVAGRQPETILAAVITAIAVLFVWNQFGGAFNNSA